MIVIEYLINALKIDVVDNKRFTNEQKEELMKLLDACPTLPMTYNIFKLADKGKQLESIFETYEEKYAVFGGDMKNIVAIRDDYANQLKKVLRGFKGVKA